MTNNDILPTLMLLSVVEEYSDNLLQEYCAASKYPEFKLLKVQKYWH